MPIYEYKCPECNYETEIFEKVKIIGSIRYACEKCSTQMKRIISKSQGKPVIKEYYSENLKAVITGPAQKSRIMKAQGVEEIGTMPHARDGDEHGKN